MTDLLRWPADQHPVAPTLSSFWEVASPRSPLAFWDLEQQVQATASQVADQIMGHHLTQVHQDTAFVRAAVAQTRADSPVALLHKGRKVVSVLLSGGTRYVLKLSLIHI